MNRRALLRAAGLAASALLLMSGGPVGAIAAAAPPAPDSGPTTGGTVVTLEVPRGFDAVWSSSTFPGGFARDVDGNLYGWGVNEVGQLGSAPVTIFTPYPTPVQRGDIPAGVQVVDVQTARDSVFALGSDHRVYAWGKNDLGQLGIGTTTDVSEPTLVMSGALEGAVVEQIIGAQNVAFALTDDGRVISWGAYNDAGQLGREPMVGGIQPVMPEEISRGAIPDGVTITSIGASNVGGYALGDDGVVYAWGWNERGELADGTTTWSALPVQSHRGEIPAGVAVSSVTGGANESSFILGDDGWAYGWGYNGVGGVGDGTTQEARLEPVVLSRGAMVPGVTISKIVHGGVQNYALADDGSVYSWGQNSWGELGDGSSVAYSTTPVRVRLPVGVTAVDIAGASISAYALGSDGNVYSWGSNVIGTLGSGTAGQQRVPVPVLGPNMATTAVTFDGLAGTALAVADGSVTVTTPPHPAGPVDVVATREVRGGSTTASAVAPVTFPGGFTYLAAPVAATITDPVDQTVETGATATFGVTVTGTPGPTVTWEVSTDGGGAWQAITADPSAVVSGDGLTLTVTGTAANDGALYRAIATNAGGRVASAPALLTVIPPKVTPAARPDVSSGPQGVSQTSAVTANDTVGGFVPVTSTLVLLDADGQPTDTVAVSGQGTYTPGGDGTVVFTPEPAFVGTATPVLYRVADAEGVVVQSTYTPTVTAGPTPTPTPTSEPSAPTSAPASSAAPTTATPPPSGLASTGATVVPLLTIGAALVAAGLGLRRRRAARER